MSVKFHSPFLTGALFGLLLAGPLAAQNRLYIQEPDDKFHAVFKVGGIRPYVMDGGKLAAAKGQCSRPGSACGWRFQSTSARAPGCRRRCARGFGRMAQ